VIITVITAIALGKGSEAQVVLVTWFGGWWGRRAVWRVLYWCWYWAAGYCGDWQVLRFRNRGSMTAHECHEECQWLLVIRDLVQCASLACIGGVVMVLFESCCKVSVLLSFFVTALADVSFMAGI